MGEHTQELFEVSDRAEYILGRLGLSWSDIEGRDVLDIGSGESALAQEANRRGSAARIVSLDIKRDENWLGLPWQIKQRHVQAEGEALPFADSSFDYAVMHAAGNPSFFREAVRVLRPRGEIRQFPLVGMLLEYWNIGYYLDKVKERPKPEIGRLLEEFHRQIVEVDGWLPNEYVRLREEALDQLTQAQKLEVIGLIVNRFEQACGLPLQYKVDNPAAREPNALLIYKKPT